jgi:hypothetical protein
LDQGVSGASGIVALLAPPQRFPCPSGVDVIVVGVERNRPPVRQQPALLEAHRLAGVIELDAGHEQVSVGWRPLLRLRDRHGCCLEAYRGHQDRKAMPSPRSSFAS